MATRSDIYAKLENGTWVRIYCHNDGDLDHNGKILIESYTDPRKIERLMKLGDLSSLGPEIGRKHDIDLRSKLYEELRDFSKVDSDPRYIAIAGFCRAYGRDRGDKNVTARKGPDLASIWGDNNEYTYVWDGIWMVCQSDKLSDLKPLHEALRAAGVVFEQKVARRSRLAPVITPGPAPATIPLDATRSNRNYGLFA